VMANFDKRVKQLTGKLPFKQSDEAMWAAIKKDPDFYEKLELHDDAMELWNFIKDYDVEVLTGIPKQERGFRNADVHKKDWVKRKISPTLKTNTVYAAQKKDFATPDSILIDDMNKNINAWIEAGGIGIRHTSTASTLKQLKEILKNYS